MTKKVRLLVLGSVLCMMISPAAFADLFGFSASNPLTTFDGTQFTATDWAATLVSVYRNAPPAGTAVLVPYLWNLGGTLEDYVFSMTITDVTADTAHGEGSFVVKDIQGDTISGNVIGDWKKDKDDVIGTFLGKLSHVTFGSVVNNTFDGHAGTNVSMAFNTTQPWRGLVTEITMDGAWFQRGPTGALIPFSVAGGSVDARVVPVPAAFLLGLLGMGVAGLRLRRLA